TDYPVALRARGGGLQKLPIQHREDGLEVKSIALAGPAQRRHQAADPVPERIHRNQAARISEHQAAYAAGKLCRISHRRRTADRISDQDGAVDFERVQESREDRRVAREPRRMLVGSGAALAGPIGRDEPPAAGKPVRDVLEVAAAVRDRMQADDWKSFAAIVVGKRDAFDGDHSMVGACAERKSFWLRARERCWLHPRVAPYCDNDIDTNIS